MKAVAKAVGRGRPENLTPFNKGHDPRRNTTGLNKGSLHITTLVREALRETRTVKDKETGKTRKVKAYDLFVDRVLQKAIRDGNERMIELVWNYDEGKPRSGILPKGEDDISELTIKWGAQKR